MIVIELQVMEKIKEKLAGFKSRLPERPDFGKLKEKAQVYYRSKT